MAKIIPVRKCIVTNRSYPKELLVRIVKDKMGVAQIDLTGKMPGRGAYILKQAGVVMLAKKKRILEKKLKMQVTDDFYFRLLDAVSD